jgi:hypothetical protein
MRRNGPEVNDRRAILLAAQRANKAETILAHTLPRRDGAPRLIRALTRVAAWLALKEDPRWQEQKAV